MDYFETGLKINYKNRGVRSIKIIHYLFNFRLSGCGELDGKLNET